MGFQNIVAIGFESVPGPICSFFPKAYLSVASGFVCTTTKYNLLVVVVTALLPS